MSMFGSLGSMAGGLFGGGMGSANYTNPADAGLSYLQQIPGTISPYYQPYIDTGLGAMGQYYDQMQQLGTAGGASDIYNQLGSGFTASPGYQYNVDQATQAAMNAGANTGMAGSPSVQQALSQNISGMAAQDYDNYMNQVTGLYNTGLGGLNNLTNLGYNASNTLAGDLGQNLAAQGGMAYAGQAGQNLHDMQQQQQQAGMWGALGGGLGGLWDNYTNSNSMGF